LVCTPTPPRFNRSLHKTTDSNISTGRVQLAIRMNSQSSGINSREAARQSHQTRNLIAGFSSLLVASKGSVFTGTNNMLCATGYNRLVAQYAGRNGQAPRQCTISNALRLIDPYTAIFAVISCWTSRAKLQLEACPETVAEDKLKRLQAAFPAHQGLYCLCMRRVPESCAQGDSALPKRWYFDL